MSLFLLMNTLYLKYDVAGWIMSTPPKVPYANPQTCGFVILYGKGTLQM